MSDELIPSDTAARYIRGNFEPADRLAVVLVSKRSGTAIQRIATAEKIASPDFQAWLRDQNSRKYEVYISMNTLKEGAVSRTKADIAAIRHVYLDLDQDADRSLRTIFHRADLPTPSFIVGTSPGKWQVSWKVENFTKEQAEHLQRTLAREIGADIAATDCTRVLRLPGFWNHKYDRPYPVQMEAHSALMGHVFHPEHFPQISHPTRQALTAVRSKNVGMSPPRPLSQSERDWSFAKRALARGESPELVAAAIATYRRYHKHDPQYYAELTVRKAAEALKAEINREETLERH